VKRLVRVNALSVAGAWVVLSAVLVLAGWGLSLAGTLNAKGYILVLGLVVGTLAWLLIGGWLRLSWRPRWRRYRRIYPLVFLAAWLLAVLGGLLHAPNNIDTITYRLPRVLHWLVANGWHWIDSVDPRMNYSGCGQEWLMAPIVSLTASDRWTWVWNALAQALLPGLLFVVLRGLGVASAVAWRWMWLLPLAPVYLLQAGSVANDLLGTAYFLAALAWGLQAYRRGSLTALAMSVLAMSLTTGVKSSNLPLVLPWIVLVWPRLSQTGSFRRAGLIVALPALLISAVPTLAINRLSTGDWTGDPTNLTMIKAGSPLAGLIGNTVQAVIQNLQPPVFPVAAVVESKLAQGIEPVVRGWMGRDFPRFSVHLTELAQEEWAGLGGLTSLLLLAAYLRPRPTFRGEPRLGRRGARVVAAGGIAGLTFLFVMGSEMTARLLAPYYPLGLAAVLAGRPQTSWVRTRAFQLLAVLLVIGSLIPLTLGPARPLIPVSWLLRASAPLHPLDARADERVQTVYSVYAGRFDPLATLRNRLPAGVRTLGFMATADDSEISGWRPFGSRRVVAVRVTDSAASLRARGISWVMVRGDAIWPNAADRKAWLTRQSAMAVDEGIFRTKARQPLEDWLLVRLQ
jgi:hypothetical protein